MPILEDAKEYVQRATGLRRPGRDEAPALARPRKPHTGRFKDDGLVPRHPRWPFVIYRSAVDLGRGHDPAAVMEDLFEANGWGRHLAGRDLRLCPLPLPDPRGARDRPREGQGAFRRQQGTDFHAQGGRRRHTAGRHRSPASLGRRRLPVVGAYPPVGTYDECTEIEDRPRALKAIPKVPGPRKDPVYGRDGPLLKLWKKPT